MLQDAGRISAEIAKEHAEDEFEKYRVIQDRLFQSDFDAFVALEKGGEDREEQDEDRVFHGEAVICGTSPGFRRAVEFQCETPGPSE